MKRWSEKLKQTLHVGSSTKEGQWRPTSNGRNSAMLHDVRAFAQQLKAIMKEVKDLSTAMDTGMALFKSVLLSPLPRAYDEVPAGVLPVDRDQHLIGLNVHADGLMTASREVKERLQQEVLLPLEQWLTEYRNTKATFRRCEELRLDLDNKRRTVLALQGLAQRYADQEAQVFTAFLKLIRDSAMLRDFVAVSLAIYQRGFTAAYTAFDLGPAPAPELVPPMMPPAVPALPSAVPVPLLTYATQQSMRASTSSTGGAMSGPIASTSPLAKQTNARGVTSFSAPLGHSPSALTSTVATAHLATNPSFAHTQYTVQQPPSAPSSHGGAMPPQQSQHYAMAPPPLALPAPPPPQPVMGYPQAPPSPNADTIRRATQQGPAGYGRPPSANGEEVTGSYSYHSDEGLRELPTISATRGLPPVLTQQHSELSAQLPPSKLPPAAWRTTSQPHPSASHSGGGGTGNTNPHTHHAQPVDVHATSSAGGAAPRRSSGGRSSSDGSATAAAAANPFLATPSHDATPTHTHVPTQQRLQPDLNATMTPNTQRVGSGAGGGGGSGALPQHADGAAGGPKVASSAGALSNGHGVETGDADNPFNKRSSSGAEGGAGGDNPFGPTGEESNDNPFLANGDGGRGAVST